MRAPAEQFLTWRAFGAPPIVIALAAQGTFRGFKDTKTPLYAIGKLQHASLSLSLSLSLSFYICVCVRYILYLYIWIYIPFDAQYNFLSGVIHFKFFLLVYDNEL